MIYTILVAIAGAIGCLTILVMLLAGSPNSSDAQLHRLKVGAIVTVVMTIGSIVCGVMLAHRGFTSWGALVAALPAEFCVIVLIWLIVTSL